MNSIFFLTKYDHLL